MSSIKSFFKKNIKYILSILFINLNLHVVATKVMNNVLSASYDSLVTISQKTKKVAKIKKFYFVYKIIYLYIKYIRILSDYSKARHRVLRQKPSCHINWTIFKNYINLLSNNIKDDRLLGNDLNKKYVLVLIFEIYDLFINQPEDINSDKKLEVLLCLIDELLIAYNNRQFEYSRKITVALIKIVNHTATILAKYGDEYFAELFAATLSRFNNAVDVK